MKVYVLTKGCYSDYHVVGVTTDEGLARHHVHNGSKYDDAGFEEFELDKLDFEAVMAKKPIFRIWMDVETGDTKCITAFKYEFNQAVLRDNTTKAEDGKLYLCVYIANCDDDKHAIKVLNEWRAQFIVKYGHIIKELIEYGYSLNYDPATNTLDLENREKLVCAFEGRKYIPEYIIDDDAIPSGYNQVCIKKNPEYKKAEADGK